LTEGRQTRTEETAGILAMILTEEISVYLGTSFALGKGYRLLFVKSNQFIQVKNQLDSNTVVFKRVK
jgi:hypothetical protein